MKKNLLYAAISLLLVSCAKDGAVVEYRYYEKEDYAMMQKHINIPATPYDYTLVTPEYLRNSFFGGQSNTAEVTLGRVLFYDKNLSKDGSVSCASCHKQELAFSDDKALSDGVSNRSTARNSLALGSVLNFQVYYGDERFGRVPFFWDNSATTVQEQSERTLNNPAEMDMKLSEAASKVQKLEYYKPLFEKAYSTRTIREDQILNAIAAFVNAMPAYNTKFDKALSNHFKKTNSTQNLVNATFDDFNDSERGGMKVYMQKCASCHGETIGAPAKTRANNGLAVVYKDNGIAEKTGIGADEGIFKVPTLRNIVFTAPYMHDGSLKTLDDVLDHYSNNIQAHRNLDPLLKTNGQPKKLNFTEKERTDLKAFLATVTDNELVKDERFSDPFKK
jgi:cytochrome c peroxidase